MSDMAVKQKEVFFFNPSERREIRNDFPEVTSACDIGGFLKTLDWELHKQRSSFKYNRAYILVVVVDKIVFGTFIA